MKIEFKFTGSDTFMERLREEPIRAHRETVNLINRIADKFEEDAQMRAPRGATGALRDSVYSKVDANELSVELGSDASIAHYNVYVEYGTRRMEARPFFRPARATALRAFKQGMGDIGRARKKGV